MIAWIYEHFFQKHIDKLITQSVKDNMSVVKRIYVSSKGEVY